MAEQMEMNFKEVADDVVDVKEVKPAEPVVENEIAVTKENTELGMNPFSSKDSFKNYWNMAKMLASSDMIPQNYQNKPMNVLVALEQAQRMNTSPLMVMQNLYIVKGKPSWSGSACSMIVRGCGLFESVDLVYVGEKGKDDWGAYVKAIRKSDGKELVGTTVDMAMAKAEGWISNSKWKSMPQQMLGYRAFSFFARLYCPNALSGFSVEGEVEDSYTKKPVDNPFSQGE